MPSYDKLHSTTSLLETTQETNTKDGQASVKRIENILEDPFTLATFSTSVLAWITTFVSSIISVFDNANPYPNFSWFSVAYMLCLILGIFFAIASNATQDYHVAIVGFLAAGIILTSSSANNIMYTSNSAREAAAAGFILLTIANVGEPDSGFVAMLT